MDTREYDQIRRRVLLENGLFRAMHELDKSWGWADDLSHREARMYSVKERIDAIRKEVECLHKELRDEHYEAD